MLFSIVAAPICNPANGHEGFLFSTSHRHTYCLFVIATLEVWGDIAVLISFSQWLVMLSTFSCTCWPPECFPWGEKSLFRSFVHFFLNWIFFGCWVLSSLYILDTNPLWGIWHLQIFSPLGRLSFRFVHGFLCCAGAFSLHVVPLVHFCCQVQKGPHQDLCWEAYHLFTSESFMISSMFKAVICFELLFV